MKFCPQCGTPVIPGAKFCVECGEGLNTPGAIAAGVFSPAEPARAGAAAGGSAALPATDPPAANPRSRFPLAFAAVFATIIVVGLVAARIILRKAPGRDRSIAQAESQPPIGQSGSLPPGHPQVIQLPAEARKFIDSVQAAANAHPNDIAAWDKLGDVASRAATFDPSYYALASSAYAHVLKLAPDDLGALRGVGNIDFDNQHYDQAIAAYEHYLDKRPGDPQVRTDLGTMYLSTGSNDMALSEYNKVIAAHPKFFQAYFNLGVAYAQQSDERNAHASFMKALALAPDDQSKSRVNQMLASLAAPIPNPQAAPGAAPPPAFTSNGTFQGDFEQMARGLPIAGVKVSSVQWPSADHARLMMNDFPMDQMPPFAAAKFLSDLQSGAASVMGAHHLSAPLTVDIVDLASNRAMQSVTVNTSAASAAANP
ncbi:MAG TPA: tetratricopeptide repeat protein [Candidatus Binataceae bacterium]|nr:tetratricopeptide repeat protein [Candidatus Binataceae bacterium]